MSHLIAVKMRIEMYALDKYPIDNNKDEHDVNCDVHTSDGGGGDSVGSICRNIVTMID